MTKEEIFLTLGPLPVSVIGKEMTVQGISRRQNWLQNGDKSMSMSATESTSAMTHDMPAIDKYDVHSWSSGMILP